MGRRSNRRSKTKKRSDGFNTIEKDLLEAYLTYYHHAAYKICFSPDENQYYNNGSGHDGGIIDDDETIRMSNRLATSFENDPVWIGGHEFPTLTPEVLEQPYLALPSTLESKQRRIVFETCIHVGLYQTSVGEKGNDRCKVISIHPDGFDHFLNPEHHQPPPSFPIATCKPWLYRNDIGGQCPSPTSKFVNLAKTRQSSEYSFSPHFLSRHKVKSDINKYRKLIQELVDYPYNSLRKDVDTIHYFLHEQQQSLEQQQQQSLEQQQQLELDNTNDDSTNENENNNLTKQNGDDITKSSPESATTTTTITIMIDTPEKMKQCAHELLNNPNLTELAFDLEAYNASKFKQATCLLQLCTNTKEEYIIDVLATSSTSTSTSTSTPSSPKKNGKDSGAVWDYVSLLSPIFANPNIVKVGHGIQSIDVPSLQRDFGIFIVNVFDTHEAAKILGLNGHLSLAKLSKYYKLVDNTSITTTAATTTTTTSTTTSSSPGTTETDGDPSTNQKHQSYSDLKKQYQNVDWRERPLKEDMIKYSILDVRFLIQLRRLLIRDMITSHEDKLKIVGHLPVIPSMGDRDSSYDFDITSTTTSSFSRKMNLNTSLNNSFMNDAVETDELESSFEQNNKSESLSFSIDGTSNSSLLEEDEDEKVEDGEEEEEEDVEEDGYYTADDEVDGIDKQLNSQKINDCDGDRDNECTSTSNDGDDDDYKEDSMLKLRYNELLMDTITKSQRQCLSFWHDKIEVPEKNDTLLQLLRRAEYLRDENGKRKRIWKRDDMALYVELFELRNDIAKKVGLMPAMLCSLDFLVLVAYVRPVNTYELKRVNYFLPEFFRDESNLEYLEDLFSTVLAASSGKDSDTKTKESNVRFYSDRLLKRSRSKTLQTVKDSEEGSEAESENSDENDDSQPSPNKGSSSVSSSSERSLAKDYRRSKTLKLAAVAAGVAVFWIGVLKRKR